MTYSSLIFASVILPLSVLFLFFDRSSEYKNLCLCITSFLFVTWGHHLLAGALFVTLIVDYLFALAVEGSLKRDKSRAVTFLILDLLVNAAVLVFIAHNDVFPEESGLLINKMFLPVGAAFYALKNFAYVYDVYSGRCKAERSPFYFITFGMSYPFMLAGPAVRYSEIAPQLRERKLTAALMSRGVKSFALGFIKSVIAVPAFNSIAEAGIYAEHAAGLGSVIGMLAKFSAVWFTFTGMSDMGTGIACMNGFDVPLNYTRLNSKLMLGGAVRCYNTSMIELFKDIRGDSAATPVWTVVLAVCGAAFYSPKPMSLIVGLITGIILAGEYLFAYDRIERIPSPVKAIVTAVIGFFLFSPLAFNDFPEWLFWITGIAVSNENSSETNAAVFELVKNNMLIIIIFLAAVSPIGELVKNAADKLSQRSAGHYTAVKVTEAVLTAAALAISFILLAANTAAV
ncbi:MAG: hypothetical protein K6B74_05655 [Ruminococcus sp.]|nr:hypothetical protein [Ruminococcus sp.]